MNDEKLALMMEAIDPVRDLTDETLEDLFPHKDLMTKIQAGIKEPAPEQSRVASVPVWRRASVMATAAALAAVVAVGGFLIDAATTSSQFAVLSFRPSGVTASEFGGSHSAIGTTLTIESVVAPLGTLYRFNSTPTFSSTSGAASSYELTGPSDLSVEVQRLATILNVAGTATGSDSNGWQVGTALGGPAVSLYNDPSVNLPRASYIAPVQGNAGSVCPIVGDPLDTNTQAMQTTAQSFLTQVGMTYTLATPAFTAAPLPMPLCGLNASAQQLTATIAASGVPTMNLVVHMAFNENGQVIEADFPDVNLPVTGVNYPLQSAEAAASSLAAYESSAIQWNANWFSATTAVVGHGPLSTEKKTAPSITAVTLNGVTIELAATELNNGSHWLLPRYVFTGTILNDSTSTGRFLDSVSAIEPKYVNMPSTNVGLPDDVPAPPVHP
jgi:hypothetical protein